MVEPKNDKPRLPPGSALRKQMIETFCVIVEENEEFIEKYGMNRLVARISRKYGYTPGRVYEYIGIAAQAKSVSDDLKGVSDDL